MTDQPELLFLLHDLARQLRVDADRRAACYGLTRSQWIILFWLERQPGLSQKELSEIMEVEPISVARLIDRLEVHGLVERRQDPADRRIWRLHLRPAATPALVELHAERAQMESMATAGLDESTLAVVRAAIRRMKANVIAGQRTRVPPVERPLERSAQRKLA